MNTTKTARARRHRVAATAAALAGLVLMLTGCGGGTSANGNSSAETSAASITGRWIATEDESGDIVVIDGDKITYIDVLSRTDEAACQVTNGILDDTEGTISAGASDNAFRVISTGTINNNQTSVLWNDVNGALRTGDESGTGSISVAPDLISLDYTFAANADPISLVPVDSAQGKAMIDGYCA
ncbi:hypothetical protein ACFRAU_12710 [Arthrobacter sp. NPDC056691]|uniref:hypothetical protein n=1 Tax=Arthrobacter sp. NPDC056691 TaxID=3345913 RepID=UPI00366FA833